MLISVLVKIREYFFQSIFSLVSVLKNQGIRTSRKDRHINIYTHGVVVLEVYISTSTFTDKAQGK